MCGIYGFIGAGDPDDLERMGRRLAHRGPDGTGSRTFPRHATFLGHRRLSVIDIADGGQPMGDAAGEVWVSFNGEIYNHRDLRAELIRRGHVFRTDHSDTEVLVHGWKEWGEELPGRLNGMFAFAVWDDRTSTLFLARDRFGEKPLFWGRQGGLFLFASELQAFAGHRGFQVRFDRPALRKYFAHGFIPAPNSAFEGTAKLRPGRWLRYDAASGAMHEGTYWAFRIEPDPRPPSLDEAAEEVRSLLRRSVERRLMSDVPLGLFLSGGIDSSAAAAMARDLAGADGIGSFAVGFTEPSYDESVHARFVAGTLGLTCDVETLDLERARDRLDDALRHADEPLADPSFLPTYLLCGFARGKVTVALSGDGGDELFAGYDPFLALAPAAAYRRLVPRGMHRLLCRLAGLLPLGTANMSLDFKLRRFLHGMAAEAELWNPLWLAPLQPEEIAELFGEEADPEDLYAEALALWRAGEGLGTVDRTLEFYSNFYLPDGILTKVDRASMAHGLEVRSVFLDNDLVEFTRRLPASYKLARRTRKAVLKRALEGVLPSRTLERPKKGFGIPLPAWMREIPLDARPARDLGLDERAVARRIAAHRAGREDHRLFLWAWRALQASAEAARP